ncbi:MAG: flagellar hook capping FlgD N-terminal domain-containing protein [Parvularculaceae bacterium]|nr:flagellar hook capping FlgD N-terminal domain-containing protein [Parvularculaceae bacterium]
MQVEFPTTTTTPSRTPQAERTPASDASAVDFQSFLRLLTAQLRNQDPLSPLDSTQFVAQLASFSTVEQLVSANARLDSLGDSLSGGGLGDYADWIGRTAEIFGQPARFDGAPVAVGVEPRLGATRTEVIVRNASGLEVDRFAAQSSGGVLWSGAGAQLGEFYRFEAAYTFSDNSTATAAAASFAAINAVRLTSEGIVLDLANGLTAAPGTVVSLSR